jgi:hypothetical protein
LPEGYILSKCFSDSVKKFCKTINSVTYYQHTKVK